ncbi:hypothetical protein EDC96DRAFT_574655 [Choanephora cucurbitarum]|nr:hypothetical protein EDC96DRAFT_574655 [Choanephora cucurbitarum]
MQKQLESARETEMIQKKEGDIKEDIKLNIQMKPDNAGTTISKKRYSTELITMKKLDNMELLIKNNIQKTKESIGKDNKYLWSLWASLKARKMPTIALSHDLHFFEKVECVNRLSRLEEGLVAPRHIFQYLLTHKGLHGQFGSKGAIVNVPVNVDTSVSSLPRNLYDNSTPNYIWTVVRYLQETPLYIVRDVDIDDENEWIIHSINHNFEHREFAENKEDEMDILFAENFGLDDDEQLSTDRFEKNEDVDP